MGQWTFKTLRLFFFVGNGAMDAPQYWQLRDDAFEYTTLYLSLRSGNFHGFIGNQDPNCQQLYKMSKIFKGLSQDGGKADFSKNLGASLFNK